MGFIIASNSIGEKVLKYLDYKTTGFNISTNGYYGDSGSPE